MQIASSFSVNDENMFSQPQTEGCFQSLASALEPAIDEYLSKLAEDSLIQEILKCETAETAYQRLVDESLVFITPAGRRVVYLATLVSQREDFLALADQQATELHANIGAKVDDENDIVYLERYWLPDTEYIIRLEDSLIDQLCESTEAEEENDQAAELTDEELEAQRHQVNLLSYIRERSAASVDYVRYRLNEYLERYPEEKPNAVEISRKLYYALLSTYASYEILEAEQQLGLKELPDPPYDLVDDFRRMVESCHDVEPIALEVLDSKAYAFVEERVRTCLQDAGYSESTLEDEDYVKSLMLKEAQYMPWIMFAGVSFVGFTELTKIEQEAWKIANDYQLVSSHVHPYVPVAFPSILKKLEQQRILFSLEDIVSCLNELDIEEECESSILVWKEQLKIHQSKLGEYQALVKEIGSLRYSSIAATEELLGEHFGFGGELRTGLGMDLGTALHDKQLKIDLHIAWLNIYIRQEQELITAIQKSIDFIVSQQDFLRGLPAENLVTALLEVPDGHGKRGHVFSESYTDSNGAVNYRLCNSHGELLDEYVTIIENALGLVAVTSSSKSPVTQITRKGFKEEQPLTLKQYRSGQVIEDQFELLSSIYGHICKPLDSISSSFDTLPPSFVRDLSDGSIKLLIPKVASSNFPRIPMIRGFLNALLSIDEAGLSAQEASIEGVKVDVISFPGSRILDVESLASIKNNLTTLGYDADTQKDVIEFLQRLHRIKRVFSCKDHESQEKHKDLENRAANLGYSGINDIITSEVTAVSQAWHLDPVRTQAELKMCRGNIRYGLYESMEFIAEEARALMIAELLPAISKAKLEPQQFYELLSQILNQPHLKKFHEDNCKLAITELANQQEHYAEVPQEHLGLYYDYLSNISGMKGLRNKLNSGAEKLNALFRVVGDFSLVDFSSADLLVAGKIALLETPAYEFHLPVIDKLVNTLEQLKDQPQAARMLAFLVDRRQVTLGEEQIYGTQGFLNQEHKWTVCPIKDPQQLETRRQELGLESFAEYEQKMKAYEFSEISHRARMSEYQRLKARR